MQQPLPPAAPLVRCAHCAQPLCTAFRGEGLDVERGSPGGLEIRPVANQWIPGRGFVIVCNGDGFSEFLHCEKFP